MSTQNKIVIVGATSAIAERCARLWAENGKPEIVLVGRDAARLESIAADLRVRNPKAVCQIRTLDFLDVEAIRSLAESVAADTVLITHGMLPDQSACQSDLNAAKQMFEINAISPVLFAEAFACAMEKAGGGTLGLIGSVAGDRGRRSNYAYGSSKALIAVYAQGLQHRMAGKNVHVALIKPGPTETPMTAHLSGMKMAKPENVARDIVRGMEKKKAVIYTPCKWQLIMLVIRNLPACVFNRMNI